ncbi:guanine nucleotide-exchange factor SEC12 isoform X1 [Centruroides vittatus]|uniref:guanine nucleotide-exchange factor SEC12 isoform X1 n=1 Tax=Centruroides vittatus TaxID=120091 RepID=UPI00350FB1EA
MVAKSRGQLLARVNFPMYTVHILTERHFLVAGGGGQAKTGIPNVIEIYELINNGSTCRAESVTHYETGSQAIMNSVVFFNGKHHVLAAGMEGTCQIYQMKYKILDADKDGEVQKPKVKEEETETKTRALRRRRTNSVHSDNETETAENKEKTTDDQKSPKSEKKRKRSDSTFDFLPTRIGFDIKPIQSFQTDFNKKDEPFQKLVRFNSEKKLMVTAGADGHIRIWKYPELTLTNEIEAHKDEVDDIDVTYLGNELVSISRDGHGYVWDLETGKKLHDLTYELPNNDEKYVFRGSRFGIVEGKVGDVRLFTIINPVVRKKQSGPCYLLKWNTRTYNVEKMVKTGTDMLSAIAVSDDGRFIGVGTLTGSVNIYIAFSLQRIYRAEKAHNIFVTGLEFLKSCEESSRITGGQDTSLISISVDNHINIHHIPKQATMGLFGIIVMCISVVLFVYILMDYLNL